MGLAVFLAMNPNGILSPNGTSRTFKHGRNIPHRKQLFGFVAPYEKTDWAKDYDVVVHDECCADVKDLEVIDRILKPHREGLPGGGSALRHALLSQRRLAEKNDALV
jgi:hypothetical protein